MTAQTYNSPAAIERMRSGMCPECGVPALGHGNDVRFWVPSNQRCNLLEFGVAERIAWQRELDARAETQS